MNSSTALFYLDSSVLLRAILGQSQAALDWWEAAIKGLNPMLASKLTAVEVLRVIRRRGLPQGVACEYLDELHFVNIDDEIIRSAVALEPVLSGADSIHVATACEFRRGNITLITHDAEMAAAAQELGLLVFDPVSDDPNRGPVA